MRRTLMAAVAAVALTSSLSACSGSDALVVGSANFVENQILAEIYAQALEAKDVAVEKRLNIGNRETYFPALQDGSLDLVPDYTGALLREINKQSTERETEAVYAALKQQLPAGLIVLDKSAAEDKDAVVLTRETATRLNAKSLADLAPACGQLIFGGASEFKIRPDGIPGIANTYNCTFQQYRELDAGGPFTVGALRRGDIQAANIFTTDASIPANDFVVLDDPEQLFGAQNVVPLINEMKASDTVKQVLNAVSAKLTTDGLAALNAEAAGDSKPSPQTVAKNWLMANGLL